MSLRLILLFAVTTRAAIVVAAPLRMTIDGTHAEGCPNGVVVVTPVCATVPCEGEATAAWRLDENHHAIVILNLPSAQEWNVAVESGRCWTPPARLRAENGEQPVALRLWPSAVLTGRLRFPGETKTPRSMVPVRIESSEGNAIPATTVRCPVVHDRFNCTVPATVLDLRIAPEEWAPQYRWSVRSRRDEPVDIGEVKFDRGGAITGFVRFSGEGAALPNVMIELAPALPAATRRVEEGKRQIESRTARVRPTARGFFHFRHLEPGPYAITAKAEGWSPARVVDVRVEDGRETRLEHPLIIESLARVEVFLQPPLDPSGESWRVSLLRLTPLHQGSIRIADGAASLTGQWSVQGVETGTHLVEVADHRGNSFARSVVEISPTMAPVPLTISSIGIEGTVRVGDDPLETRLAFRNRQGRLVKLQSDAEGRFSAVLPEEGRWEVAVGTEGKYVVKRTVEIRRNETETTRVDLELPGTSIDVSVVSETGKPLRAHVRAMDPKGTIAAAASTDEQGRVRLFGLDADADLRLSAKAAAQEMESGAVPVLFDADGKAGLTLVMQSQIKVRVALVTPSGRPVAGALIRFVPPHRRVSLEEVSGPSGEFEIVLPHDAGTLEMAILPPAMPIKLVSMAVHPAMDRNPEIVLGGPAATLEVAMSHAPPFPLIRKDGGAFSAVWLVYPFNWTSASPQWRPWGITLSLEAGNYAVCSTRDANCKTVSLVPGAIERIDAEAFMQ